MSEAESGDIQRAIAGDGAALERLLEATGGGVRAQMAPLMPERWRAVLTLDDLMQQTYLDVFLAIRRFEPGGGTAFEAWVVTIARRNLHDAVRLLEAEKRGGGLRVDAVSGSEYERLFGLVSDGSLTPSRLVAAQELQVMLRGAVSQLPALHREVVERVDLEGEEVGAVAGRVGRTRGAVYMLRARAHRWLREILGGSGAYRRQFA
ncbi:MAG: hypothetical protein CHACPFDD_01315 [Phycisphaerae bacterium]|nr:hypothetical protein [Phycisphaerae bacterium]